MEYSQRRVSFNLTPKVGLATIIFFVQLFLFVSSDWIYGSASAVVKPLLIAYLMLQGLVIGFYGTRLPTVSGSVRVGLFNFAVMFVLTGIVLLFIPKVLGGSIELLRTALASAVVLHIFVITYTEENIFRGILPKFISDFWANIMFSLFHLSMVMGLIAIGSIAASPARLLIGFFFLGMLWSLVRTRMGITGSWGSHTAYNLKAIGVLQKVFGL